MITFGPVPSRRLGRSLGINNIPPKICSYACVYCQVGKAIKIQGNRQEFYKPAEIYEAVKKHLETLGQKGEKVDYLSFVPDGEPTLDIHLGEEITMLKDFGLPIAVITNASLLTDAKVREELMLADLVNIKVDAVSTDIWKRVDKPFKHLDLNAILNAILIFSTQYQGILYTETMLVKDKNDQAAELDKIAEFIGQVDPHVAYIGIPTRPPAEDIQPADEQALSYAYHAFKEQVETVELLTGTDPGQFGSTGDPVQDILSITAVHPMSYDALWDFLAKNNVSLDVIQDLVDKGLLIETEYQGRKFFMRRFKKKN